MSFERRTLHLQVHNGTVTVIKIPKAENSKVSAERMDIICTS